MKLKTWVEIVLDLVTMILIMFAVMVDDMSLEAVPLYLLIWVVILFNLIVLKRYGKGVIYEDKI